MTLSPLSFLRSRYKFKSSSWRSCYCLFYSSIYHYHYRDFFSEKWNSHWRLSMALIFFYFDILVLQCNTKYSCLSPIICYFNYVYANTLQSNFTLYKPVTKVYCLYFTALYAGKSESGHGPIILVCGW